MERVSALIVNHWYWNDGGVDGVVEPDMVFYMESFAGERGGREGVKLEQQIVVTEDGPELLSTHSREEQLLQPRIVGAALDAIEFNSGHSKR